MVDDAAWAAGRHPGWPALLGPLRVAAGIVEVRKPKLADAAAWSRIRLRDRDYLEVWEPIAPGSWVERNNALAWPAQFVALRSVARRGQSLPFVITVDGWLAGQVTVGNIVRGSLCSAWVGYWVGSHVAGGGVATAAVALAVDHCFNAAGLHRVEATVQPDNAASLRVLAKLGFREEGVFRRYLQIGGVWRDHLCLAVTADEVGISGLVGRLVHDGTAKPV